MEGLTNEQEQEYQRAKKVSEYLDNHQVTVNTFLPLVAKQSALNIHIGELEAIVPGKLVNNTGLTTEKQIAKAAVGTYYEAVCGVTKSYLLDTNNFAMAVNYSVTKNTIVNLADGEVRPLILMLNKGITDELLPEPTFAPYGITALTLTDGLNLANLFHDKIGEASSHDADKTAVSIAIEKKMDVISKDIISAALLVKHFIIINPDFYNGFVAANKIDDIGVHHSGIRGDVQAASPVSNATIACAVLNKSTKSNLLGEYELIKMKPGLYEFTCSHVNFATLVKIIKIKRGKILEIDWQLSASIIPNNIVLEADVPVGSILVLNSLVINPTPATMVIIEILGNLLTFSAVAALGAGMGPITWSAPIGLQLPKTITEFAGLIGADDDHEFIVVENQGPSVGHYKITFTNLQP